MNKDYTATVAIKVKFLYNQSAWVPIDSLPTRIVANVSGSGWSVALLKIKPISPVLVYKANIEGGRFMLSPSVAKKQLIPLLARTQVNYIVEDERTILFDSVITRNVVLPIHLIARADSSITTASICIKGPSILISHLIALQSTRITFEHTAPPKRASQKASFKAPTTPSSKPSSQAPNLVLLPSVLLLDQYPGISLCQRAEMISLQIEPRR